MSPSDSLDQLRRDLMLVLRRLRRQPGFTAVAAFTLALGIGATTAMFSVVRGVLLEPLPYTDADRLASLWHSGAGEGRDLLHQSTGTYFTYREANRVFEEVGLWDGAQVTVSGLAEPERVDALLVTQAVLPMLGARPIAGRLFTADDDAPGAAPTVVLDYGYWQRHFGGDPAAVGRVLTVNGGQSEIIGVLPPGFEFPTAEADLYFPIRLDRGDAYVGRFNYQVMARLRPGVTLEEAEADLRRMIPLTVEKFPSEAWTPERLRELALAPIVTPLKTELVGRASTALWLIFGAVGVVLLIACANVANLMLVRASGRRRDVAVCAALGASRGTVIRELVVEALALGAVGGGMGVALAFGGLELLRAVAPETLPRLEEIALDGVVLAFAVGTSGIAALACALLPALQHSRPNVAVTFREAARSVTHGDGRSRDALAAAQVALVLLLLIGSGLMIRSFQALRAVDPGFRDAERVLTFRLFIPSSEVPDEREAARAHREILTRIEALPGVVSASLGSSVPMFGATNNNSTYVEDFPAPEGESVPVRRMVFVAPGYFETLGTPLLAGRTFDWRDVHDMHTAAVVTENFAREYWSDPALAVGKRVREGRSGPWKEIIGVVGNVHDDGVDQPATTVLYWPMLVTDFWGMSFFGYFARTTTYAVRTVGPPTALLGAVRRIVHGVNPNLPLASVQTLQDVLDRSVARTSFTLVLLTVAAGVALLLGVVGLYGVVSYVVQARTREIGIRMAVGAARVDVTRMVVRRGLVLAGIGVVVGLLAAAAGSRLMRSLLFGVAPVDVVTYGVTALLLVVIAGAASYLPAQRAAKVDPMRVLREE